MKKNFNELKIGDIFRIGVTDFGHEYLKIGEYRPGFRLDEQDANAIDLATGHHLVFGGMMEVRLIRSTETKE